MYEQQSHYLLNSILDQLKPEIRKRDLRHFYTRLGANFYAIHSLFHTLYGQREDFQAHLLRLVGVMATQYIAREPVLKSLDSVREQDHHWFLRQEWVGMALYLDGFAGDLEGLAGKLPYLQELGVNMVHVMPILECPVGASDGGYAVSDFRNINARAGNLQELASLAGEMRRRQMLLTLDAVAFLWKKIGTTSQNEREAHLILQLFKDCCQVTAPGVLFIAEAIVAPVEIIKYFGEDAVIAKECEIAYNATFMALMWDAVATKNARLLNQGISSLPDKLDRATWLTYIRCHDDIGLGFDDADVQAVGYEPGAHRKFLIDYFTGAYVDSPARGWPFGRNEKTGDARFSGSLASLVGLETALQLGDEAKVQSCIDQILLLHSLIMAFGGIPLLYYGDELGTLNNESFVNDADKAPDSRWIHRPSYDWQRAELRHERGSVEHRIFEGLKHMIAVRKSIEAMADFNNRELIDVGNPHLFGFTRTHPSIPEDSVLVVTNFNDRPEQFNLRDLRNRGRFELGELRDLVSGVSPALFNVQLVIPAHGFYWLVGA